MLRSAVLPILRPCECNECRAGDGAFHDAYRVGQVELPVCDICGCVFQAAFEAAYAQLRHPRFLSDWIDMCPGTCVDDTADGATEPKVEEVAHG